MINNLIKKLRSILKKKWHKQKLNMCDSINYLLINNAIVVYNIYHNVDKIFSTSEVYSYLIIRTTTNNRVLDLKNSKCNKEDI